VQDDRPVLEEIATEQEGKLQIGKLNIDDNLDVTRRYDVMSIPTLILFKDGEVKARLIGAKPKASCSRSCRRTCKRAGPLDDARACRSALARRARRSPTCAAGWTRSVRYRRRPAACYGPATRTAVEAFQHRRG